MVRFGLQPLRTSSARVRAVSIRGAALIGELTARNARDYVVEGVGGIVHLDFEMDFGAAGGGTEVISDRETATPGFRDDRALHIRQQRFGVTIGNGQHRDLHHGGCFCYGKAL